MWDIFKAFKVTKQKTRYCGQPWIINIFCDPQTIINNLTRCNIGVGQALKMQIYRKAKNLVQQGYSIIIRWMSGYSERDENDKGGQSYQRSGHESEGTNSKMNQSDLRQTTNQKGKKL